MKSIQKTFKKDSVEVDILDFTRNILGAGLDVTSVKTCRKIEIPRDSTVANQCMEQIAQFLMEYGEEPGFLMVGWKTHIQLELEVNRGTGPLAQNLIREGILYFDNAAIVVDDMKDFYIKPFPRGINLVSVNDKPESEKIIEEFEELTRRAVSLGVGINKLRKVIGTVLVNKVLDT